MYQSSISILGGITAETFFTEYWGKKPLLVRNAMPDIVDLIVPDELIDLALMAQEEDLPTNEEGECINTGPTARLITQHGKDGTEWRVKHAPLADSDFSQLPELWTLLVQAVDHWSPDVNALWQHFNFLPQFRRDDIMISYAPKGGSVGKHFDFYDVFLVQAHGTRRWQLGQMCDAHSPLVPKQPMKLLPHMDVWFDELLEPGDLLYIPPGLSHYGVAQNDCVTFSFGFRMPNAGLMLEEALDTLMTEHASTAKVPFVDHIDYRGTPREFSAQIHTQDMQFLKQAFVQSLEDHGVLDKMILTLLTDTKFPDALPEPEEWTLSALTQACNKGVYFEKEPAVRLLWQQQKHTAVAEFWCKGAALEVSESFTPLLQRIAEGDVLFSHDIPSALHTELLSFMRAGIILLVDAEDA